MQAGTPKLLDFFHEKQEKNRGVDKIGYSPSCLDFFAPLAV
jgi:hypothetical protein